MFKWLGRKKPEPLVGRLESIDLTFGGAGNQVMTIGGVQYATWVDYTKWPPIGSIVTHEPYYDSSMGRRMLATRIISHD